MFEWVVWALVMGSVLLFGLTVGGVLYGYLQFAG